MKIDTESSPQWQDHPQGPSTKSYQHQQIGRTAGKTTTLSKVAFCLTIAALLTDLICIPSPFWLTGRIHVPGYGKNDLNIGIFYGCTTKTGCGAGGNPKSWQIGLAVVEFTGFLCSIVTTILLILYVFVYHTKPWVKKVKYAAMTSSLLAGVFISNGNILAAANRSNVIDQLNGMAFDIGWSFAMAAISALLFIVVAVILLIDTFL